MITSMMDHIKFLKSSPDKKDSQKYQDPTTMVPARKRAPPLKGAYSTEIGGMWNLRYEIS